MVDVGWWMWDGGCGMVDVGCGMWDVRCRMWDGEILVYELPQTPWWLNVDELGHLKL
jgi:hypothetical protein